MNQKLLKHVDYIASLAKENGYKLTTVRFVKFLYLLDILYIKHTHSRLTNWTWKFWDFGPYCSESLEILREATEKKVITSMSHPSQFDEAKDKDYNLFTCLEKHPSDLEKHIKELEQDAGIDIMVQIGIRSYIKEYGNDTSGLLNHVYFSTLPMINANPREKLDFSSVASEKNEVPVPPAKLSRRKIKKAKKIIEKMKQDMLKKKNKNLVLVKPEYLDSDYIQGMTVLSHLEESEEDIDDIGYASIESLKAKS